MQILFKTAGYVALAVPDAETARDMLRRTTPQCLVITADLPDISGVELLADLRTGGNDTPAVIVAGHEGGVPGAVTAMRAGASDFLEKPLLDARLLLVVRKLIEGR